jgi:hypothetical protein
MLSHFRFEHRSLTVTLFQHSFYHFLFTKWALTNKLGAGEVELDPSKVDVFVLIPIKRK